MTKNEYLLTVIAEESNEVSFEALKSMRFGINNIFNDKVASEKLLKEFYELQTVIEMLLEHNSNIKMLNENEINTIKHIKRNKLEKYLNAL